MILSKRRWLSLLVLAALTASCRTARTVPPSRTVEAEEFRLEDKEGRLRASLRMTPEGSPALTLHDEEGSARLVMGIGSEGSPSVEIFDRGGKVRASLGLDPAGSSRLLLSDRDGRPRASLALGTSGMPILGFVDENGRCRLELTLRSDWKAAGLHIVDADGKLCAALSVNETNSAVLRLAGHAPTLHLLDDSGRLLWSPK